ncbi:MAG: gliding motility-associated C-terminal domain-containing protein [Bacteroidota bacterium]
MFKYKKIILALFIFCANDFFSQAITASNCTQAINICSNAGFQIDPNGAGSVNELPGTNTVSNPSTNPASANSGCLLIGESNSTWMIVNIQTSGVLQFSFGGGGAQAGFYDWAMWPYSPTACAGIQGNTLPPVRCNWNSLNSGGTGLASPIPAGGVAGNYEPPLNVTCGQKFVICFSNYSGAATTVPLNFFGSAGVSCVPIPNPITVNSSTICGGQTAVLTASGAAGNTYTWTPGGANGTSISVSPGATTTYTVSGSGGCGSTVGTQTSVVTVSGGPVSTISSVGNSTPGGGADATPAVQCLTPNSFNFNAPAAAGTHAWNFGGGGATPATSSANSPTGIVYNTPGTYIVTHSVNNGGCVSTSTTVVTITAPPTAVANSNPVCAPTNGASVVASGGSPGYTYNWSPSGGSGSTATGLTSGLYSVTTTDASGCSVTSTVQVTANPFPSATLSFTNPNCGASNGVVVITNTSPGSPPQTISYASSLGSVSGQTVTGLGAGTPVITLTNNFGCTFTVSATLTSAAGPNALPLTPNNIICGTGTGSITIGTVTGGTAPYTYNVNGGAFSSTPPVTGLPSGTYTVGVRDANGCIFTNTVTISVTTGPTAIAGITTPAGCGMTNGTYNITGVTGGTSPYTYTVNGVASGTGSLTTNLAAGTYPVIVKDANGCLFNTTFVVGGTNGPTSATILTTNASCGSANGSATVTGVTGGLASYNYSFDGSAFAAGTTTTGLSGGPHTVIIKDANTCTLSVTYNILNTGSPTASVTSPVNVSCFGFSNASFAVTPVGGTGPSFTYTLTGPVPTQTNGTGLFSGLPQGTYNITVKDQVGCVTTTSVTLTQPTLLTLTATPLPALCFGTASGSVSIAGTGGTPTYSYNLNSGAYQSSSNFNNVNAALYTMGIMDANGCTATQTIQVTQPPALNIVTSSQNANCTAANGVGSATVSGGVSSSYTYLWTGSGGAAATSNSVVAGNYTITASDANGCTISSPVVIGLTPGGSASIVASASVTCNGQCNGSLTAGMTGGASPFMYSWAPGGQTSPMASNLCPGNYTCTVTDFYGCVATITGTIIQPPALTAIMNSNNVKCFGTATGTVSAAGTGGTFPYTYNWTTPIVSNLATVPNVAVGSYICHITDANNCAITQSIAVTEPTPISLTSTVTAANCNLANGCATITISGGSGPYIATWSNGTVGTSICNVFAGTYTIDVQDANNCTQTLAVTIPNLAGPTLTISSFTNVSCFGGNNGGATATASGGTTPYTYSWNTGPVTPVATNLIASVYTASVTDGTGCIASASVAITEPAALVVNIVPTQPKCFAAINGGGSGSAVGGTPNYTYTWSGGGGSGQISNPLGAGNYALTVTDDHGCVSTATMALVNPPAMVSSITSTNVTCFGLCNGTAVATSTNGIGVISYYWTGTPSPVTSPTLTGACAGSYTVLATDQNSCTASAQINITQPPAVTASISSTGSVTCNGGNNGFAAVNAGGGTGSYTYNWLPGNLSSATANTLTAGVYVVTVSDINLCSATATATIIEPTALSTTLTTTNVKCNGASDGTANIAYLGGTGATTFVWGPTPLTGNPVNSLNAGPKTVTITSNSSCITVLTFTLTEPAALTAVVSATNSNCGQANGQACAVVSGGTGALTSLWSNGVPALCNNNIVAGAYTYSVTDANGCVAQASGLVNDIAGPVVSVTSQTNISCFGGNNGGATTSIIGGVIPYNILWSGTPTFTSQNVGAGFNAGIKNITVTDAAGCVGTASVNITQPTQLITAIGSSTNVSCFGLSNGGATVLVSGGTGAYTYSWSPSTQITGTLTNVPVGIAICTISDANGCSTTSSVSITQPQALTMAASSFTNVSCFGGSNGQISTTVQGGIPGYTYVWSPSGSAPSLNGLPASVNSVTVTDANSCSINASFNITQPSVLTSTFTSLPATCGLSNGSATVTLGGGTPAYNLVWNIPGTPTGPVATNMAPGVWSCNGIDALGCTITQTVNVISPPVSTITGFSVTPPSCFGLSNGDITINYTAGSGPYTVSWSNPISQTVTTAALSQTVAGVSSGLYNATLTDFYGCTASQPVNVTQPGLLVLIPTPNVTICYGQSTQISASGQNGTPAYSYTWSSGFSGGGPHTVNPTTTTSYTVTVADIKGCSPTPKVITVNVTPQLLIASNSYTLCHDEPLALSPSITSAGNGGPYTYNWTPSGNTSTINVIGNAPGLGVTTATYAVIVNDGCTMPPASAVFTVYTNPLPTVNFTANKFGCAPLLVNFTATTNEPNSTFTWEDNIHHTIGTTTTPTFEYTYQDSGKYSITLHVTNMVTGCSNDSTKIDFIEVYQNPIANFYADPPQASILEPTIGFINTSVGANTYYWDFGDPQPVGNTNTSALTNPSHTYSYVGPYGVNLVATSSKGCTDIKKIIVEILPDFALYIPNTFTPDGNGINDIFQPMGVGIDEENYRMDIYDRWGENIFTSNAFRKGWDGTVKGGSKMAEQGVYTYKLMVKDTQGNKHPYVGHVTVLKKEN